MFTYAQLLRLNRISALYDIIVTWPLATPWSVALLWSAVGALHARLGLPAPGPLTSHGLLFANFAGSVVLIWSAARLWLADVRLLRLDGLGRWLFSLWLILALAHGASPVLCGFLAIELCFAALQVLPARASARGAGVAGGAARAGS